MRVPSTPLTRGEVREFLLRGPSLLAATRDDRMAAELCRCAAAMIDDEGRVWVAVPMPEGKRTIANVESTGVFALNAALPSTYTTVQLKGADAKLGAWPDMRSAIDAHRHAFANDALINSLPITGRGAALARLLWSNDCIAISFTANEMFDQTPGPSAGLELAR